METEKPWREVSALNATVLPSSLDGEVVGSLAFQLTSSCGCRTGKRGQKGSLENPPDARGCFHFTVK